VSPWYGPKDLAIRATGDPAALIASVRRMIREADPTQAVSNVQSLQEIVEEDTASRRAQLAVLGAFGGVALLLAAVGIHGLLAFTVSSRTREIGVRIALGARRADILSLTAGDALRLAAIGITIGVLLSYGVGRLLQSLLAGVSPWDPETLTAAAAVALMMALAGSLLPAIRAIRVDPTTAMRAD
jgi:ABC-type antimicrobial peptide transport system permease subunit